MNFRYLLLLVFTLSFPAFAALEIAKVGDTTITDAYIKSQVSGIPGMQIKQLNDNIDAKNRIVENLITEELFVQEAVKKKIDQDQEFKQQLEKAKRRLLAQTLIQKTVIPKVNEKNLKQYFQSNKKRYSLDEVRASHILLKSQEEADEVYGKAKKKGADFSDLAKKYSQDPSVTQNLGDLGYFTRARMVPEFSKAAFAMKKGQISKPVKSPFGYHVIKVIDKRKGKPVKYKDVGKRRIQSDYQNQKISELVKRLKKQKNVKVNSENVKKMRF